MVKIKYTGPGSRVIAGKHVFQGETCEVNEKLVNGLRGDPDLVFSDELPGVQEAVLPKEPIAPKPVKPTKKATVVPEAKPDRKPRSKKK